MKHILKPNEFSQENPLKHAINGGSDDAIKALLEYKGYKDDSGTTDLMLVVD